LREQIFEFAGSKYA